MPRYVMIMKGSRNETMRAVSGDWTSYIRTLIASGKFRGGSSLGNGMCLVKGGDNGPQPAHLRPNRRQACAVNGYMRFEADSIDEVQALLVGNPAFEAGGVVEILEEVVE